MVRLVPTIPGVPPAPCAITRGAKLQGAMAPPPPPPPCWSQPWTAQPRKSVEFMPKPACRTSRSIVNNASVPLVCASPPEVVVRFWPSNTANTWKIARLAMMPIADATRISIRLRPRERARWRMLVIAVGRLIGRSPVDVRHGNVLVPLRRPRQLPAHCDGDPAPGHVNDREIGAGGYSGKRLLDGGHPVVYCG